MADDLDLVPIRSFSTQLQVSVAKSVLDSAGIPSVIQADSAGGARPDLTLITGGYHLLVRAEDAADADVLLTPET